MKITGETDVVQLRTQLAGATYFSGDFWIFTAAKN